MFKWLFVWKLNMNILKKNFEIIYNVCVVNWIEHKNKFWKFWTNILIQILNENFEFVEPLNEETVKFCTKGISNHQMNQMYFLRNIDDENSFFSFCIST